MLKLPADQRRGTGVRPRSEPQISGRTHLVVGCGFVPVPRTALHGRSCDEIALAALPHRRQTTDVAVSQSSAFGCRHRTSRRASHVYRHSTPVVARVEKDLRPEDCSMDAQGRRSSEEMWRRRPDLNRGGGLRRKLAIGLRRRMARCGFKIAGLQPAVRAAVKRGGIAHPMPPSVL